MKPGAANSPQGVSQNRADAVASKASEIIIGLEALAALGGWRDEDTVSAIQVRWFCSRLESDAMAILRCLDPCQPEPEART